MQSETRNPVELLAEEFAERIRAGESPSIDDYVARQPQHADSIRSVFASILTMERAGREKLAEQSFESRAARLIRHHETLGDFRIVRQVGRGGMGIVYEAIQQSLGRRVALKVLSSDISASPTQLRRFKLEAEAVAKLHHTNIVPVYGISESEGLHYYAMQFIDGTTLTEAIQNIAQRNHETVELTGEDTVQYMRLVAGIGRDVAEALNYAHQNGIIHRDIKPSNLMLDQDATIWVTDFGLAKHMDEETQTKTGNIVGTLRYMAPEQFSGEADQRSDIYSLGLTLFEMLALRPAYRDATQATLVKAKTTQPTPDLISVRYDVPRDLETIVSKACAADPLARYQTGAELANDLQRFLDDRAILARRASLSERFVKWARRNPVIAALSTAVVSSLAALAIVFASGNYKLSHSLEKLHQANELTQQTLKERSIALTVAEEQRALAANNLGIAVEAFEEIMENIGNRGGAESLSVELNEGEFAYGTAVVTDADAAVLRTLLKFFDRFSQDNATDLAGETALANRRVGDILYRLGRIEEAEVAYHKSLDYYSHLAAIAPDSDTSRLLVEQLRVFNALTLASSARGDAEDAMEYFRKAKKAVNGDAASLQNADAKFEYARALNLRNSTFSRIGLMLGRDPRQAFVGFSNAARQLHRESKAMNLEAIELLTALVDAKPARADYALELAHAYREQIRIARIDLDPNASQEAFKATLELMERLIKEHPESPYLKFVFADMVTSMAPAIGRRPGVANLRAAQIANSLIREYPQVPDYRALKAKTLLARGDKIAIEDAVRMMQSLVDDFPAITSYRFVLANGLQRLARMDVDANRTREAKESLDRAIKILESSSTVEDRSPVINAYANRIRQELKEIP